MSTTRPRVTWIYSFPQIGGLCGNGHSCIPQVGSLKWDVGREPVATSHSPKIVDARITSHHGGGEKCLRCVSEPNEERGSEIANSTAGVPGATDSGARARTQLKTSCRSPNRRGPVSLRYPLQPRTDIRLQTMQGRSLRMVMA